MRRKALLVLTAGATALAALVIVVLVFRPGGGPPSTPSIVDAAAQKAAVVTGTKLTPDVATAVAAGLTSADPTEVTKSIAAYRGWKAPANVVTQLAALKIAVLPGSVTDNGDRTGTATYDVTDAGGKSAAWTVTLIYRTDAGRWQVLDTGAVAR